MVHFRGSLGMLTLSHCPVHRSVSVVVDRKASPTHILRFNTRKDSEPQVVYVSYWLNEDFEPIPL